MQNPPASTQLRSRRETLPLRNRVLACIDESPLAGRVTLHALAVAQGLGASVTLLRVLEAPPAGEMRADPVEWDIRRHAAREALRHLTGAAEAGDKGVEIRVVEGQTADQLCLWAERHAIDFIVVGTHGESSPFDCSLGGTARQVVERATGSVLLVPPTAEAEPAGRYRRILVPVDGSSRAESVLPLAIRLASACRAQLLLAHVVPVPELTEVAPLDAEDIALRERVVRRNERVGRAYLDRLRTRLAQVGLPIRVLLLRDGEVRRRLTRAIAEEGADLVVLAADGRGDHADQPYGSVTAHLMMRTTAPLLIVRDRPAQRQRRDPRTDRPMARLPADAVA